MSFETKEYTFDNASIQRAVEDVDPFLEREKVGRQDALRLRLTLEELLLRVRESGHAPETFRLSVGKRFGKASILLRYHGGAFDPTVGEDADDTWQSQILSNLGLSPAWNCRRGVNTVKLGLPRADGASQLVLLLIAVLAAAVVGAAGNALPEAVRAGVTDYLLTPVFNAFLGLLNTFAGLMIFLTVSSGVFGIGDTASLNRIGKTAFPRFILTAFAAAALTLAVTTPFVHLRMATAAGGESQLGQISEMIFNILPRNPVQPFLDGNTLQIIVLAALTGVVLLILGGQAKRVSDLIEEFGGVVRMLLELVCRLIPLFVFVSLVRQIWAGAVGEILGLWKPFCLFLLSNALLIALVLLMTAAQTKTSPALLLKKALPAFFVAFTTASSMASFSAGEKDCVRGMGVSKKLFDFGFPVGIVIYMPSGVTTFALLSVYLAEVYDVEVNAAWFIMAGVLAAVLSIAIPPVPGAMLTCYGILMAQLNIPMEGMLLAATLDVVLDFFMSGVDILTLQWELVCQAGALHMLNEETLRRSE